MFAIMFFLGLQDMPTSDVLIFQKVHIILEGCRPQARLLYRKCMSYRPNTNVPECLHLNPSPLCIPFTGNP